MLSQDWILNQDHIQIQIEIQDHSDSDSDSDSGSFSLTSGLYSGSDLDSGDSHQILI